MTIVQRCLSLKCLACLTVVRIFFKVNGVFIVHTFILSIRIYGKVELKVTYSIVCNVYRHSIPGMTSDDGKLKAVVVLYELKRSVV